MIKNGNRGSVGLVAWVALLGLTTVATNVQAAEWQWIPRADIGLSSFEFNQSASFGVDQGSIQAPISERRFRDTLSFLTVGLSTSKENLYLDVYYRSTDSGSDSTQFNTVAITSSSPNQASIDAVGRTENIEWDRTEYALTLGYFVSKHFSVFAGYRNTKTEFDSSGVSENLATNFSLNYTDQLTYEFTGPYLGANHTWQVAASESITGVLSAKVSATLVDGEVTEKFTFESLETERSLRKGETLGLNFGVTWSAVLSDRLNYSLSVDTYQYAFNADRANDADFGESVTRYSVGLSMPLQM